jgi:hypothetical protein
MDDSDKSGTRPQTSNAAARAEGPIWQPSPGCSAHRERPIYGYLGWGESTDSLMEQLRGPVDHL